MSTRHRPSLCPGPMAPLLRSVLICRICGRTLQLESCNFDEDGQAVHEDCYTLKLVLGKRKDKDSVPVPNDSTD